MRLKNLGNLLNQKRQANKTLNLENVNTLVKVRQKVLIGFKSKLFLTEKERQGKELK